MFSYQTKSLLCLIYNLIFFSSEKFNNENKKARKSDLDTAEFASEDSVFNLLANANDSDITNTKKPLNTKELGSFSNLINQNDEAEEDADDENKEERPTKHVPVDWCLKTKLRLLSKHPIPGSRLTSIEEASGITG